MKTLLIICTLFFASTAFAGEVVNFTEARFEQLKSEDASILIDVYATWCPTCRQQKSVIEKYLEQNPKSDLTVLKVNYDDQKKWVKHFKAFRQSTLIMYKGEKEVDRSIAETNEKKLFTLFAKTK